MVDRRRQRRAAPKRALIGPLAMLAGGAVAGVLLWRTLMLEPRQPGALEVAAPEGLTAEDRRALERMFD
jgi:hypothetical protein